MINRKYSGNDWHLWPFTFSQVSYSPICCVLDSGDADYPGCTLRFGALGFMLIIELPPVIRRWRKWVDTSGYEWGKPGGGYFDEHSREYGFSVNDGFLQVFLGPQTGDSRTTKDWGKFIPWTQWRFNRFSLYNLDGTHFWTQKDGGNYSEQIKKESECEKAIFLFNDFDGEGIEATCNIEEREWLFGEGWFKWLSWFRNPKIQRSLDISFNKETGKKKGSWKGGTLGHGIELKKGELSIDGFKRYCVLHNMIFRDTQ